MRLNNLDVSIQSWFDLEGFHIPLIIHIKDIERDECKPENMKVDIYGEHMMFDKTKSPFQDMYKEYDFKREIIYFLKFIDTRKMFEGCRKSFLEYNFGTNNLEEVYHQLMELGLTTSHFIRFRSEVIFLISEVKRMFIESVIELLDYERQMPNYPVNEQPPRELVEATTYTNGMTEIQTSMEYSDVIFFEENIGKAVSSHSWREIELKCLFVSMKNKVESISNRYQAYKMEESRKQSNKPK